ncbi:MAG: phage holin family protein [Patescibacteria group bacterium]
MWHLFFSIVSGILGLFLAQMFVPGVSLIVIPGRIIFNIPIIALWQILILTGGVLGLLNFFLKPILKLVTLPLRIITLGLFTFAINMSLVWLVDIFFPELEIKGLQAIFWTALIIFGLGIFLNIFNKRSKKDKDKQ